MTPRCMIMSTISSNDSKEVSPIMLCRAQEFKRLRASYNAARDRADLLAGAHTDSLTQAQVKL